MCPPPSTADRRPQEADMELLDHTAVIYRRTTDLERRGRGRSLKVDGSAARGTRTCKGSLAVGNR